MDKINVKSFKSNILPTAKQFIISPYSSSELNLYGKALVLSDKVSEPALLSHCRTILAYILPLEDKSVEEVILKHKELIKKYIRIQAPYIGVYDINGKLLINEIRMD